MPRPVLVLGAFVVCFLTLQVITARHTSATWDEPAHLTAGYAALTKGDYRIDPAHPPFARMWAALPLLLQDGVAIDTSAIDAVSGFQWVSGKGAYSLARQFLYTRHDGDRLLFAARMMIVSLGLLLGILIFCWVREWLGLRAAALSLVLYLLSPNLTGHASLVTTDLPVTCFCFGAMYFLWRSCRQWTPINVAGFCVFFALAATTKFSALLMAPAVALIAVIAVMTGALTWRRAVLAMTLVAATTFVAIWAVYGFRFAPAPAGWTLALDDVARLRDRAPFTAAVAGWLDGHHLLPNAYTQGILLMQLFSTGSPSYLAGEISPTGWWYYFPFAFLIKTPIALIVLMAGGLLIGIRAVRDGRLVLWAAIAIPVFAFIGVAMTSAMNVGIRHILPIFPFVLLLAAAAAHALASSRHALSRVALTLLLAIGAGEYVRAYPTPLTFFNGFVGGPANGYRYLADSNLGWGQQLKPLQAWMAENGVRRINLAYFGQADPAYYDLDYVLLPGSSIVEQVGRRPRLPGYVAISGTILTGVGLNPVWRLFYQPFFEMEPVAVLGHSMRIYWVNTWPVAPVGGAPGSPELEAAAQLGLVLQQGMQWPELARKYLTAVDRIAPGSPAIQTLLQQTMARTHLP
jgi:4-amino-4-deoxy-L-arabinose transferase-like glycosyltransferase